ncbi:MAG TPA: Asp23/Gls24 family envelope stress response protein [Terriglobales bacterium]|nr:Asp23/Gls24 family envelope stress response protein [Terriglobales bacterium]
MPERSVAGKSIVTRRAIVDIVRTAVQSSYGVTGFSDASLARRLLRWIGLDRSGIRLSKNGGLHLDLYITVAFGVPVAEVARQVDSAVRYSLRHYVGAEAADVAIHVDGLRYQPMAIERAEAIERTDTVERVGKADDRSAGEPDIRGVMARPPAAAPATDGATASRKCKPR